MNFKIITLGCKVNTYESEYILEQFINKGYIYNEEYPDIVIVNTCSVTNNADNKSLKIVRRVKRDYPESILVVCGCSSQNNQAKYQELGIDILIGNKEKSLITTHIDNYLNTSQKYTFFSNERNLPFEKMQVEKFPTHTRAFIKIQDGCDNFCSYCIIPYTRGSIRSKDFHDTISEATKLVDNGHLELVLTGIHTGSYNSDGKDLSDLITALSNIDKLKRIRLSSIEITELDDKFLKVLQTNSKLCHHLHIPLQSGSQNILKRMNRKYDKIFFQNKIKLIRSIHPDIAISTDVIVGHPYESSSDFKECLEFCQILNFSKIHVFPYSLRTGTAASFMPEVDNLEKKNRAHELLALSNTLEQTYLERFIGKRIEVLTEEYIPGYTIGHTSNYILVYIEGSYKLNSFYDCTITNIKNNIAYATITSCHNEKLSI